MTTGEPLVVRVAMKPIATLMSPLRTVELPSGAPANAQSERSDVTAVPAMGVIAEALVAMVLADAMLEKFGGDSMAELSPEPRGLRRGDRAAMGADSTREAADVRRHLVLIGLPGAGKSTVGRLLAERLETHWTDIDPVIERATGLSIAELFAEEGEAAFRAREHQAVIEALLLPPHVVTPGGGWAAEPGNLEALGDRAAGDPPGW